MVFASFVLVVSKYHNWQRQTVVFHGSIALTGCPLSLFPCFFFLTMTLTLGAWNHGPLISNQAAKFAPWKHPAVWTKGMRGKRTFAAWCHCTLVVKTTREMVSRKNTFLVSCCSSYGLVDKSLLVAVMPSTTNDSDAYWFESYCNRGNCWLGCVTKSAAGSIKKAATPWVQAKGSFNETRGC